MIRLLLNSWIINAELMFQVHLGMFPSARKRLQALQLGVPAGLVGALVALLAAAVNGELLAVVAKLNDGGRVESELRFWLWMMVGDGGWWWLMVDDGGWWSWWIIVVNVNQGLFIQAWQWWSWWIIRFNGYQWVIIYNQPLSNRHGGWLMMVD